jgi:hypothetical protein
MKARSAGLKDQPARLRKSGEHRLAKIARWINGLLAKDFHQVVDSDNGLQIPNSTKKQGIRLLPHIFWKGKRQQQHIAI